mgnify:CR=1 FL=1
MSTTIFRPPDRTTTTIGEMGHPSITVAMLLLSPASRRAQEEEAEEASEVCIAQPPPLTDRIVHQLEDFTGDAITPASQPTPSSRGTASYNTQLSFADSAITPTPFLSHLRAAPGLITRFVPRQKRSRTPDAPLRASGAAEDSSSQGSAVLPLTWGIGPSASTSPDEPLRSCAAAAAASPPGSEGNREDAPTHPQKLVEEHPAAAMPALPAPAAIDEQGSGDECDDDHASHADAAEGPCLPGRMHGHDDAVVVHGSDSDTNEAEPRKGGTSSKEGAASPPSTTVTVAVAAASPAFQSSRMRFVAERIRRRALHHFWLVSELRERVRQRSNDDALPPMSLEQARAFHSVVGLGRSAFISGGAGTGKSILLHHIVRGLEEKFSASHGANRVINLVRVTAPTGVAAVNINGQTLHSFVGFSVDDEGPPPNIDRTINAMRRTHAESRWLATAVLIVDEVSMVTPKFFQHISDVVQALKGNRQPFGGIQMVLIGDFLQLPPIKRRREGHQEGGGGEGEHPVPPKYAFETAAWRHLSPEVHLLKQVFRQSDPVFINLLNEVRFGKLSNEGFATLRALSRLDERSGNGPSESYETHFREARTAVHHHAGGGGGAESAAESRKLKLRSRRQLVEELNQWQFESIPAVMQGEPYEQYLALQQSTSQYDARRLMTDCPFAVTLNLCVGTRVMLVKQLSVPLGLANGSLGVVVGFVPAAEAVCEEEPNLVVEVHRLNPSQRLPVVRFDRGIMFPSEDVALDSPAAADDVSGSAGRVYHPHVVISPRLHSIADPASRDGPPLATCLQIPLVHSWAITIHKSQGLSLDAVDVSLSCMFEPGQAYVALSRARSISGLRVHGLESTSIRACVRAKAFYQSLEEEMAAARLAVDGR